MGSSSDRQDQAEINQQSIDDLLKQIGDINPNVENRFDDYKRPFGYKAKRGNLDRLFKLGREDIDRTSAEAITNRTKGTTGRLASQGITGGSILEEAVKRGQKDIYKNKFNAIRDLETNKEAQNIGLMNQENKDRFNITGAASNIDLKNMFSLFRKYGLLGNTQQLSLQNIGNYSNSNVWDDIFQGVNAGANIYGAFKGGSSGSGVS